MKRFVAIGALFFLVTALVVTPAAAKRAYSKVKGHVVKVEQHVRTANGGEYDRLTIRTRNGDEMQLRLGEGGACEGCYQEGDRIRARIRADDGGGGPMAVQSMKVRRNGEMYGYVNADGKMVRAADGNGGQRMRSRAHEPGSGSCPGCNSGQRGGGRGGGGGGGRRGGGGGGGGGGS
jgi:hypothetical protein